MFYVCCTRLYVHSSIAIILMRKRELVALLNLSSWCLVMIEWLFLAVPWGCLRFVILVFPDHTHLLFWHPPLSCLHTYIYIINMDASFYSILPSKVDISWTFQLHKRIPIIRIFINQYCLVFEMGRLSRQYHFKLDIL